MAKNKTNVVFAGGLGTEREHFSDLNKKLEHAGFGLEPVVFDSKATLDEWVKEYTEVLNAQKRDYISAGFSFGSVVAACGAGRTERLPSGLIVCSMSPASMEDFEKYPYLLEEFKKEGLSKKQLTVLGRFSIREAAQVVNRKIPVKVLLGQLESDKYEDMKHRSDQFAEWVGSNTTYVPNAGHNMGEGEYYDYFINAVRNLASH